MAAITTTVSSPDGPLYALRGRVSATEAVREAYDFLVKRRDDADKALSCFAEWTVESQRGSERVRSFEEMQGL